MPKRASSGKSSPESPKRTEIAAANGSILQGAREALAIARGEADPATYKMHVPNRIDVKAIREQLGLNQAEFSARFGFSIHTLRKWEQAGRQPEGPARAYLRVIARNPKVVEDALRSG